MLKALRWSLVRRGRFLLRLALLELALLTIVLHGEWATGLLLAVLAVWPVVARCGQKILVWFVYRTVGEETLADTGLW